MRVLICGSRGITGSYAYYLLKEELEHYWPISEIIHGACPNSPDEMAAQYAHEYEIKVRAFPAEWAKYGRRAGFIRNSEMIKEKPAFVVAVWDGLSKGTEHTIKEAVKAGIPVRIVPAEGRK